MQRQQAAPTGTYFVESLKDLSERRETENDLTQELGDEYSEELVHEYDEIEEAVARTFSSGKVYDKIQSEDKWESYTHWSG